MARFNTVVKYIFYVIVVFSAGVAVERFTRIKHWKLGHALALKDVLYNVSSRLKFDNFSTIVRKHHLKCLTDPRKPFCLMSAHKRLEIFQGNQSDNTEVAESRVKNMTAGHTHRIHSLLVDFAKLMEDHNVRVVLVEPSILFCLLSAKTKNDILLKAFNPSRFLGSSNVITVGVVSEDSAMLEGTNLTKEALFSGFKLVKFKRSIGSGTNKAFESVHYIFVLQDIAVHVVVFYPRESYWWHAGMDTQKAVEENLLFVEEGIFEKFSLLPLKLDGLSIRRIFLPHDIRYFMLQMGSSQFLKCNASTTSSLDDLEHPSLTTEELNNRAEVALKELKAILAPQLVLFWLWSKSLLGWSSKCDIFHYSTTLELAVMHKSIEGLDLDAMVADNENLEVSNHANLTNGFEYRMLCHGLEINLSILHEDQNLLRKERNDGLKNFNLTYPEFTLCSTELYNLKIQVPCVSEDILRVEEEMNESVTV